MVDEGIAQGGVGCLIDGLALVIFGGAGALMLMACCMAWARA